MGTPVVPFPNQKTKTFTMRKSIALLTTHTSLFKNLSSLFVFQFLILRLWLSAYDLLINAREIEMSNFESRNFLQCSSAIVMKKFEPFFVIFLRALKLFHFDRLNGVKKISLSNIPSRFVSPIQSPLHLCLQLCPFRPISINFIKKKKKKI